MGCLKLKYRQSPLKVLEVNEKFALHPLEKKGYPEKNCLKIHSFGFNGKEQDNHALSNGETEILYDYGFRIYNPNIAKFLSVDPLSPDYPWYTPYQFAGNTPIMAIDLDGLEPDQSINHDTDYTSKIDNSSKPDISFSYFIKGPKKNAPYQYYNLTPKGNLKQTFDNWEKIGYYLAKNANSITSDNAMAARMFKHFLLGEGIDYDLDYHEMERVNPLDFNFQKSIFPSTTDEYSKRIKEITSRQISTLKNDLSKMEVGETNKNYKRTITGAAQNNGTLGEFSIVFIGALTKTGENSYIFNGTYQFNDVYDFDPNWFGGDGLRSSANFGDRGGESEVRQVWIYQILTGRGEGYPVLSEEIDFYENGTIK